MPTPKKIYLVQTNDPNELNQTLAQINEDVTKANDNIQKSGTFYMFDWEKDYADTL